MGEIERHRESLNSAFDGARYSDTVFDDKFTITDIEPEKETADASEIELTLEYDRLGEMTVNLEVFQHEDGIELLSIE